MKLLSEKTAIKMLLRQKEEFTNKVVTRYEHKAKVCASCDTPGLCCTDEHFVNVHITRLEARQINQAISSFPAIRQRFIREKINEVINRYGLSEDQTTSGKTFSCPLYERSFGCLIHQHGKPLPCIVHACYENRSDLPPEEMLVIEETSAERLNKRVYGTDQTPVPLPVALLKYK